MVAMVSGRNDLSTLLGGSQQPPPPQLRVDRGGFLCVGLRAQVVGVLYMLFWGFNSCSFLFCFLVGVLENITGISLIQVPSS